MARKCWYNKNLIYIFLGGGGEEKMKTIEDKIRVNFIFIFFFQNFPSWTYINKSSH